jgi:hypothetical protein
MNILSEAEDLLYIHFVTFKEGYHVERKETMSRKLFDSCLRTGYLMPLEEAQVKIPKSA